MHCVVDTKVKVGGFTSRSTAKVILEQVLSIVELKPTEVRACD